LYVTDFSNRANYRLWNLATNSLSFAVSFKTDIRMFPADYTIVLNMLELQL